VGAAGAVGAVGAVGAAGATRAAAAVGAAGAARAAAAAGAVGTAGAASVSSLKFGASGSNMNIFGPLLSACTIHARGVASFVSFVIRALRHTSDKDTPSVPVDISAKQMSIIVIV